MRYWRGRTARFVEVNGGGSLERQSLAAEQLPSANGSVRGQTPIGGRIDLSGVFSVTYQPLRVSSQMSQAAPPDGSGAQDLAPAQGIVDQTWLATMVSGTASRKWSPRRRLEASVTALRLDPIRGVGDDSRSQSVSVRERWNANPRAELSYGYTYRQNRQGEPLPGTSNRLGLHAADGGLRIEKRLSSVRMLTFAIRGGIAYSTPYEVAGASSSGSWLPVVSGAFQANLSQAWDLSVTASHEVTVLTGVTPQPFTTDQVSTQVTGNLTDRLRIGLTGAYSQGTTVDSGPGSFEGGTGTVQVQYGLARWCGVFSSYSYYEHRLREISSAPASVPSQYGRHAVRVGVSFWVPLYGTF